MAKNKHIRSMSMVSESQQVVEQAVSDKFASVEEFIQPSKSGKHEAPAGRINPQLSCTIEPEDKDLLNEIALYACNREKRMLNTSIVVRALIRLGNKYKDELVF
jgi:hypothetical protein